MIDHKNRFVFGVLVTKGDNSLSPPLSVAGSYVISGKWTACDENTVKNDKKGKFFFLCHSRRIAFYS